MTTRRKTSKGGTKRRTKAAKYVVNARFKSIPLSKSAADKLAKGVRSKGGAVTVKKV